MPSARSTESYFLSATQLYINTSASIVTWNFAFADRRLANGAEVAPESMMLRRRGR